MMQMVPSWCKLAFVSRTNESFTVLAKYSPLSIRWSISTIERVEFAILKIVSSIQSPPLTGCASIVEHPLATVGVSFCNCQTERLPNPERSAQIGEERVIAAIHSMPL
jgi:hypothetical protein